MNETIYDLVKKEEQAFKLPISLIDGWNWNFFDHVKRSFLYKNSQFYEKNEDRSKRPFKNIVRPILNLQHRAEGFDVKDIQLFVNSPQDYYKTFLVEKFHEKWAREKNIDTFIDKMVESYVDYGGVLVKDVSGDHPEVVDLRSMAFCDQTDILSGTFAIKHYFSPQQLRDTASMGWGKTNATIDLETLISLSKNEKKVENSPDVKTPGKYIEIYEVHGTFVESYLGGDSKKYSPQIHIIGYYKNNKDESIGVTLFASKEPKLPFKFLARDEVYGRALGFGGVEELFEAQTWTNYSEIQMLEMLDLASKTFYKTTDPKFKGNNLSANPNGDIFDLTEGRDIQQIDTTPKSMALFERSNADWNESGKEIASVNNALMGNVGSSHTAFRLQSLLLQQGTALHEYRRGKIATFLDEIYRDWIMPYIVKEITKGQVFLAELDLTELQQVADALVTCESNDFIKNKILNGETVTPDEVEAQKQLTRNEFMKGGNMKFLEIFKGEMKEAEVDVRISIGGKQKDLSQRAEALTTLLKEIMSTFNPQTGSFAAFDDPRFQKMFNQIVEDSGFNPVDFYVAPKPQLAPTLQPQMQQNPQGQQAPQSAPQPAPQPQLQATGKLY